MWWGEAESTRDSQHITVGFHCACTLLKQSAIVRWSFIDEYLADSQGKNFLDFMNKI
jgi:hypothetical protein